MNAASIDELLEYKSTCSKKKKKKNTMLRVDIKTLYLQELDVLVFRINGASQCVAPHCVFPRNWEPPVPSLPRKTN